MINDINLSTILLLVTISFLIYCLTDCNEPFADVNNNNNQDENVIKNEIKSEVEPNQYIDDILLDETNPVENKTEINPVKSPDFSNYDPNNEETRFGASLDTAFDKPLPDNINTNTVDLNRNNVINYESSDYLPKEINDDWFNTDFSQAKFKLNDDKLINTEKYIIGINTVGQSLKNASYDIRGSINVPKFSVSPWNNSTTEPDYNLKPLC
jgi:hypothetical protein